MKNWFLILCFSYALLHGQKNDTWVVVLDPGHGGKDPGATGKLLQEKQIVLDVALRLEKYLLTMPDVKVILTRKKDIFLPLHERASIANKNQADLFVSIHCNASKKKDVKGFEIFVMGMDKSDENLEVAMKENSVVTMEENYQSVYKGIDPNSAEAYIIFSNLQSIYLQKSLQAATIIKKHFEQLTHFDNRGIKQAPFFVLWKTTMPSVLIELEFISNAEQEKLLAKDSVKEKLAYAIYKALVEYRNQIQGTEINPVEMFSIQSTQHNIVYLVQFASLKTPLDTSHEKFRNFRPISVEKQGSYYVYFSGKFSSNNEADKHKKWIISQGYKDAIVVSRKVKK
ncbi:MAG: N-acetylmuramoyl-L-alanine amidase [Bacteroidales bacterium]|nr:N-acetylmuramoyl-L-alanine amidase [Bacteroidales bacterium]